MKFGGVLILCLLLVALLPLHEAGALSADLSNELEPQRFSDLNADPPDSMFEVFPLARGLHAVYQYRYDDYSTYEIMPIGGRIDSGVVMNTIGDSIGTSDTAATWSVEEVSILWHKRWGYLGDTTYSTNDTVIFPLYESTLDSHEVRGSGIVWGFPLSSTVEHIYRYSHGPHVLIKGAFGQYPQFRGTDSIELSNSTGIFYRAIHTMVGDPQNGMIGTLTVRLQGIPVVSIADHKGVPQFFELEQNYPNPFNPSTTIRYALQQRTHVTLSIYNTLGQLVRILVSEDKPAGFHEVKFDGNYLASGVYFYRLRAGSFVQTRKLLLLK